MILKTTCKQCKKEVTIKIDERSRNFRELKNFLNYGKLCDECLKQRYINYYE